MNVDLLDYALPEHLIASSPPLKRDGGRLMHARDGEILHRSITDLVGLIPEGALLVFNNTKVLPARLLGHKPSGGKTELFLLRKDPSFEHSKKERWFTLGRSSKGLSPGSQVHFEGLQATVLERQEDGTLLVEFEKHSDDSFACIMQRIGHIPLPPYMRRQDTEEDKTRYQTVFADKEGAVAAPTAGLHFTEELLTELKKKSEFAFLTLHVGLGTFQPVTVQDLDAHPMHEEWYEISAETAQKINRAKAEHRPIVAIGTTSLRALESAALLQPKDALAPFLQETHGSTKLLIQPGFSFQVVDLLFTNFHLPKSTLLALVYAFSGRDHVRRMYELAIREEYRFFSYGDAMLLERISS